MVVKEERLFLLRKLCQQLGEIESNSMMARSQSNNVNSPSLNPEGTAPKKTVKKRTSIEGTGILQCVLSIETHFKFQAIEQLITSASVFENIY